jgi:hypothetical protein
MMRHFESMNFSVQHFHSSCDRWFCFEDRYYLSLSCVLCASFFVLLVYMRGLHLRVGLPGMGAPSVSYEG